MQNSHLSYFITNILVKIKLLFTIPSACIDSLFVFMFGNITSSFFCFHTKIVFFFSASTDSICVCIDTVFVTINVSHNMKAR
ncbi:hypothetical protein XENTR_v10013943 [Xenopus tropicalis]|nr:hypothetical protein XENTR_v10013943 [Xenopus tropicalis]